MLTTRAVLGLTRRNALDRSRPLVGCFGNIADLVRTQLSESSRISPRIKGAGNKSMEVRTRSGDLPVDPQRATRGG
jgi:hypothetical protein